MNMKISKPQTYNKMINTTTSSGSAALVLLVTAMLFAPVASAQESVPAVDVQSYQAAINTISLSNRIQTGKTRQDARSWWNCSIDTDPVIEHLHVRFWQTGEGYSGHHALNWNATSASKVNITIGKQNFSLTDIAFNAEPGETESFRAVDANGAKVSCLWSGPRRGSLENDLQFDEGNHLLENQLIAADGQSWQCKLRSKDGKITEQALRFSPYGVGNRNETNFLWYIDTRYNVILSFKDKVSVLWDIKFSSDTEQDDSFEAYELSSHLSCSRVTA